MHLTWLGIFVLCILTALLTGVIVRKWTMGVFDTHEDKKFEQFVRQELATIRGTVGANHLLLLQIVRLLTNKPILLKGSIIIMPKTINVGDTAQAVLNGVDQFGKPFPLDATYKVTPTASAPADVSVGPVNPDGSFQLTGVAADPGDQIGATVMRPDGTVITFTPDTLIINAPAPVLAGGSVVLQ